jgi:hypothetical protein
MSFLKLEGVIIVFKVQQSNKKGLAGFSPCKAVSSQLPAFQGQDRIIIPMIIIMLVRDILIPLASRF